jgi:hypothetical protein
MTRIWKLLIFVLALIFTVVACDGYSSITLTYKNTKFSLEVPQSYEFTPDTVIDNGVAQGGIGLGIPFDSERLYHDPELSIVAFESYDSVKTYLDELLNNLKNPSSGKKFELIDRFSTSVSGIDAEQVVLSIDSLIPDPDPRYPAICRRVYFKVDRQIWIIDLISSEKLAEQAKVDFDHIIKNFQFIK